MTFKDYADRALQFASADTYLGDFDEYEPKKAVLELAHASLGLTSEVHELSLLYNSGQFPFVPITRVPRKEEVTAAAEELGDLLWFSALAARALFRLHDGHKPGNYLRENGNKLSSSAFDNEVDLFESASGYTCFSVFEDLDMYMRKESNSERTPVDLSELRRYQGEFADVLKGFIFYKRWYNPKTQGTDAKLTETARLAGILKKVVAALWPITNLVASEIRYEDDTTPMQIIAGMNLRKLESRMKGTIYNAEAAVDRNPEQEYAAMEAN